MAAQSTRSAVMLLLAAADLVPHGAKATIDPGQAQSIFQQAHMICSRDNGARWGRSLCGPMLLVDPDDRSIVANQPDAKGVLKAAGPVFVGTLPASEAISDTTSVWSGTIWCELIWPWPMREDPDMRHVTLAHEMFHRIQSDLHFEKRDGDNAQLDTLDGRMLLQLEWRALAAALRSNSPASRRSAVADAVLFRRERYRLFPAAAANEAALEANEGIAEYTGVKIGLSTPDARTAYALWDLAAYSDVPSLVRSFAYSTGPAYGLLLDQADPGWTRAFARDPNSQRFDERLAAALHLPPPDLSRLKASEAVYDPDGSLHAHEIAREKAKLAEIAGYTEKFEQGPVLSLPLKSYSIQFKPQSLVPLGNSGMVYPTATITDEWGTLTVASGGMLLRKQPSEAVVSASGFDRSRMHGSGYTLQLNAGWTIRPGARGDDLSVRRP